MMGRMIKSREKKGIGKKQFPYLRKLLENSKESYDLDLLEDRMKLFSYILKKLTENKEGENNN